MIKALLGKKLNMTQVFDNHGRAIPVTVILATANLITAIKDGDKDGYKAVQLGFGKKQKVSSPLKGSLKKATAKVDYFPTNLKEVAFDNDVKVGQTVKVAEVFAKGSMVDVVGISHGKGFAGVVKRHGFKGGPKTHGQSDRHRAPGSIGATTTPGRVFKGLRMAGHMGVEQVTTQGLEVVGIDTEAETILIKGAVPGPYASIVLIKKSLKKRKKYHEPVIQNISLGEAEEEKKEAVEGESASGELKTEAVTQQAKPDQETNDSTTIVEVKADGEQNADS